MKGSTFGGLLLVAIGIILLLVLTTDSGATKFRHIWSSLSQDVNTEKTIAIDDFDHLDIETSSTNIIIKKGNGDKATVHLYGRIRGVANKDYILDVQEDPSSKTVNIQADTSGNNAFTIGYADVKLTITIPEKNWTSLTVRTKSGNIILEDQLADQITVQAKSGNVTGTVLEAAMLNVQTVSGNVKLDRINSFQTDFRTTSGNLKVSQLHSEKLHFDLTSGDAKIIGDAMQVNGSTKSGNIQIILDEITDHSSLQSRSGNINVVLEQEPNNLAVAYNGKSGDGNVSKSGFEYNYKDSNRSSLQGQFGSGDIKLEVNTRSGNFKLK